MKNRLETSSIIELARTIQKRPRMWLSDITLTGLSNFLDGFALNYQKKDTPPFEFFKDFVCNKLKKSGSSIGYIYWILNSCGGDEEKSFISCPLSYQTHRI